MFESNPLTFNPGWTGQAEMLTEFAEVREIQQSLRAKGLTLAFEADESATGPAPRLTLSNPDRNPILIDQHVHSPPNLKKRMARQ
jgi:hypothetical protein